MFEIGIFSVIVLAVSYWAVLWVMGRREDVLHGEFVEGKAEPDEPVRAISPEPQARPGLPGTPAFPDAQRRRSAPYFPKRPTCLSGPRTPPHRSSRRFDRNGWKSCSTRSSRT